jgi:chromosome partitioning protein
MTGIIAVLGRKGGSGKTSTAYNLAGSYAAAGRRCLLVDLDSQASLTRLLGDAHTAADGSIGARLTNVALGITDLILPISARIHLIPGDRTVENASIALANNPTGPMRLGKLLLPLRSSYDVIIIDTAPALGFTQQAGLMAADLAVVPTRTETTIDIQTLPDVFSDYEELREYNQRVAHSLTVLPTMHQESAFAHRSGLAALIEAYGDRVATPVPYSLLVGRSLNDRRPLAEAFPRAAATEAYRLLAVRLAAEAALVGAGR